jgi:glycosyltransferase involved in cell wall biosynthesis
MKLAVVIPWFGREVKGGAEQQAWQIATRLAARGHAVDVLTTCCRSHQDDWATNHLPAGATTEPEGFTIRRFAVDRRDRAAFDEVCSTLQQTDAADLQPGVPPVSAEESTIFANELIKSAALLEFLEAEKERYDWFIFLPYLYGPILHGVGIVGERAALQPCLHDEAYAYLPEVATAFHRAGRLLFNSEGELELALRLLGPGIWHKSHLVGEGVEVDAFARNGSPARAAGAETDPFVLYLGRKEAGKNVPMLVDAFQRFRRARPNAKLKLLLAGTGALNWRTVRQRRRRISGLSPKNGKPNCCAIALRCSSQAKTKASRG